MNDEYLLGPFEADCGHGGRLVPTSADDLGWQTDSLTPVTESALKKCYKVVGCSLSPPAKPCDHVEFVLAGQGPGIDLGGQRPLLKNSLVAMTNGAPPGLVLIKRNGGSQACAGTFAPQGAAKPRDDGGTRPAAVGPSPAKSGLTLDVRVDTGSLPSAVLPPALFVILRVVQGQREYVTPLRVPIGEVVPVPTGLDPALDAWYCAGTHGPANDAALFDAVDAPFCVSMPKKLLVKLRPEVREQWHDCYDKMLRASRVARKPGWPTLAVANGLPRDNPNRLPPFLVLRMPRLIPGGSGRAEVVLRPVYPHLFTIKALTGQLQSAIERHTELFRRTNLSERLAEALVYEVVANGTYARAATDAFETDARGRPLYVRLLDAYAGARDEAGREIRQANRALPRRKGAPGEQVSGAAVRYLPLHALLAARLPLLRLPAPGRPRLRRHPVCRLSMALRRPARPGHRPGPAPSRTA